MTPTATTAAVPTRAPDHNRTGVDFHQFIARPPVRGTVIDFHSHLLSARHADVWFQTAKHYGIDAFVTMSPLEEALVLERNWPGRLQFIAIPRWQEVNFDDWHRRLEAFYNLGSRIIKFHMAPGTMHNRSWSLDSPPIRKLIAEAGARDMILMSHVGDPQTWYDTKYADTAKFGTRDQHYAMWEAALAEHKDRPWLGAHLGGNPEDMPRLQRLLDAYPNLYLDLSATRWMVREVSRHPDEARAFVIRNQDRIVFGTDQVSGDDRGFDFLASRFWAHRKLWESDYHGPSPIFDPDLPEESQPTLHGLALPDEVLQKLYHDNAVDLLARVGASVIGHA
ncbi:MAG: amidohydrolase family protein [Tepidisphaeraceae bacterium]